MSGIVLRLEAPAEGRRALLEAWFWRAAAGWCVPVVDVTDGLPDVVPEETEGEPASRYAGPTLIPALLAADGVRRAWCTWAVALPDASGALVRGPYLRRRGAPLVVLTVDATGLSLRFAGHSPLGAPEDAPDPDRLAAERARHELAEVVGRLDGVTVAVRHDAAPAAAAALASALGLEPPTPAAWTPSPTPGPCLACRHANQGTFDLSFDGVLACRFAGGRPHDAMCDVSVEGGFAFERWDGANGTWFDQATRR